MSPPLFEEEHTPNHAEAGLTAFAAATPKPAMTREATNGQVLPAATRRWDAEKPYRRSLRPAQASESSEWEASAAKRAWVRDVIGAFRWASSLNA